MHDPQASTGPQRHVVHHIVSLSLVALTGCALALVGVIGVLAALMAKTIVTPVAARPDDTRVIAVNRPAATVTLERHRDSLLPGNYSLFFSAGRGHARIGDITDRTARTVTRRVVKVDYGNLAEARRGRLSGWLYTSPRDLGLAYIDVNVPTSIGAAPAWLVPADAAASAGKWVIQVHGRGVRRQEALRALPVFHTAGYTSLLVSYRNDQDAPFSSDARYGLGDTEWTDIDAAVEFAVDHGATSVVLMGWSMGGAVVLQTLTRSARRGLIEGIVLDSPVIDWADVVATQAADRRLPRTVARGALAIMGSPWGRRLTGQAEPINFARLDFVTRARDLERPILLLHSNDDGFVPANGSHRLAERRPDIVTFVEFSEARHTKLWNYDPARWNASIADWLAGLPTARHAR